MRETVGRYLLKAKIGSGGMATVYLAEDPRFEREVAIKILPRDLINQAELQARFTREARVIASLEHPAIVPVYDYGEEDDQPYLVMRYMRGGSLRDRMQSGPMSLRNILELMQTIGAALEAAHARDLIHRDVKPANILYDTHDNPHLSDFGIVKLGTGATTLTGEATIGTPAYMSPEQARGEHDIDRRTDVYSMGVVLFHLLTGETPYEADTPMGVAVKHITEPVPSLEGARPDLPSSFDELIQRSLAKQREERFPTVAAMIETLDRAVGEQAAGEATVMVETEDRTEMDATVVEADHPAKIGPTMPVSPDAPEQDDSRPRWLVPVLGLGALLAVVAVIGTGIWFFSGRPAAVATTSSPVPEAEGPTESRPTSGPADTARPAATTAVSALPDTLLDRADFGADDLDYAWRWSGEAEPRWSLSEREGWFTTWTGNYGLRLEGGEAPVLLGWTALGDFDLVTRVLFEPGQNFQSAGLLAFEDDDHFVALSRAYCDTSDCVGDGAYFTNDRAVIPGEMQTAAAGGLPQQEPILLRLRRDGDRFVGFWSVDDGEWRRVGETEADLALPRLGLLIANGATGAASIPASFDYLELYAQDGGPTTALSPWLLRMSGQGGWKIGLVGPRSGPATSAFEAIQLGAELAVADFGALQGRSVELVVFEADCSVDGGAAAARAILEAEDILGVVGPTCSTEATGALPIFERARIVMVSPSVTGSELSAMNYNTFNRVILHAEQPGSREGGEAMDLDSVLDFLQRVESETGTDLDANSFRFFAAYAYDATSLLLHSAQSSLYPSPSGALLDRIQLLTHVRSSEGFAGITGDITLQENGDRQP